MAEKTTLKCVFCKSFKVNGPWGKINGSINWQYFELLKYNLAYHHTYAHLQWLGSQRKILRSIEARIAQALDLTSHVDENGLLAIF
jgi:hypothetical protein